MTARVTKKMLEEDRDKWRDRAAWLEIYTELEGDAPKCIGQIIHERNEALQQLKVMEHWKKLREGGPEWNH